MNFLRRIFVSCIFLLLLQISFIDSLLAAQVHFNVDVVYASNDHTGRDPDVRGLGQDLPYDSLKLLDQRKFSVGFSEISEVSIPPRPEGFRLVYHLYIVFAKDRDNLLKYCLEKGIDAKIHYPIPIYKQSAVKYLGYKDGDFPVTDAHVEKIITFPCDQHLEQNQLDYIISTVSEFYGK